MNTDRKIRVESEIVDDWCSAEISKTGIKIMGGWLEPEKVLEFGNELMDMASEKINENCKKSVEKK